MPLPGELFCTILIFLFYDLALELVFRTLLFQKLGGWTLQLTGLFFFTSQFRAYDRAAIKFRGVDADINFNLNDYEEDLKQVWQKIQLVLDNTGFDYALEWTFYYFVNDAHTDEESE